MTQKDIKSLSDDELIEAFRDADPGETLKAIEREIASRIQSKANSKHPKDCLCSDCMRGDKEVA